MKFRHFWPPLGRIILYDHLWNIHRWPRKKSFLAAEKIPPRKKSFRRPRLRSSQVFCFVAKSPKPRTCGANRHRKKAAPGRGRSVRAWSEDLAPRVESSRNRKDDNRSVKKQQDLSYCCDGATSSLRLDMTHIFVLAKVLCSADSDCQHCSW